MDFYNSASFKRAFPDYNCKTGTKKVTGSALVGVWKERKEIAEEKARLLNEKFDRQQKFKAKGAAAQANTASKSKEDLDEEVDGGELDVEEEKGRCQPTQQEVVDDDPDNEEDEEELGAMEEDHRGEDDQDELEEDQEPPGGDDDPVSEELLSDEQ